MSFTNRIFSLPLWRVHFPPPSSPPASLSPSWVRQQTEVCKEWPKTHFKQKWKKTESFSHGNYNSHMLSDTFFPCIPPFLASSAVTPTEPETVPRQLSPCSQPLEKWGGHGLREMAKIPYPPFKKDRVNYLRQTLCIAPRTVCLSVCLSQGVAGLVDMWKDLFTFLFLTTSL